MEHDTAKVLSQLEQRMNMLDWLIGTNPAADLLHEYEVMYHDHRDDLIELAGSDADVQRDMVDLLRRAETAIRLIENLHLSLIEPSR